MNAVTQEFGPCPCRFGPAGYREWQGAEIDGRGPGGNPACRVEGTKLTKYGHLVGCTCRSCLGRRNRRKGQKAEARGHKRLGGQGRTVRDDLYYQYSLNHSVEMKTGAQVPATFRTFISGAWIADALRQAEKKLPVGSDALPTVLIELSPSKAYLVTDVSGKELRG